MDLTGMIIIGVTLAFVVYIVIGTIPMQREYAANQKLIRGLLENKVRLGGSDGQTAKVVDVLAADGQAYTLKEIDRMMFDDEQTWVMFTEKKGARWILSRAC